MERFFKARLGIAPTQYAQMVERLCESAVEVGQEVMEAARNESRWHTIAKQMVHAWNDGMASLQSPKTAVAFRGLSDAIAQTGFSEPEKPERVREVIGGGRRCWGDRVSDSALRSLQRSSVSKKMTPCLFLLKDGSVVAKGRHVVSTNSHIVLFDPDSGEVTLKPIDGMSVRTGSK